MGVCVVSKPGKITFCVLTGYFVMSVIRLLLDFTVKHFFLFIQQFGMASAMSGFEHVAYGPKVISTDTEYGSGEQVNWTLLCP